MAQHKKKGMCFRQGAYSQKSNTNWLIQALALIAMFVAVVVPAAYSTGLWSIETLLPVFIAGVYICMMYAILAKFEKENLYNIIVLIVILLLVFWGRDLFIDGLSIVWNKIGNTYTASTGIVIPDIKPSVADTGNQLGQLMFLAVTGVVTALICCFITTHLLILSGVFPFGLIMAEVICFDTDIPFYLWGLVSAAALFLVIYSCWKSNKLTSAVLAGWTLCAAVTAAIAAGIILSGFDNEILALSQRTEKIIHEKRYETQYTTLPEGNLKNYTATDSIAQQALSVSMSVPQQLYLRGFAGAVFEDDVWTSLDTKTLAENEELLYWFNLNGYNPNTQFAEASKSGAFEENKVTVHNTGACSKYMYVPFSLKNGEYIDSEDLNADSIAGNGQRAYTYTTVSCGKESISVTLQQLQKSNEENILSYRKSESAYRNFVYDNYLQVPESIINLYGEFWDNLALKYNSADNLTIQQAQECALLFLSHCFPEGGTPDDMELPLKQADGTSYQYATVAALTLRYFGIPSRYAEGYVITEDMALAAQPDSFITVDGSCTRAWVEVYQDGIGWIPMDLTPGLGEFTEEQLENLNAAGLKDNSDPDAKEGEELEENPEDSEDTPSSAGGFMVRVLENIKKTVSLLFLLLVVFIILIYIRRKIIIEKKMKLFNSEDINDSVTWIYADIAKLLEQMGFCRGNGSMTEMYEDLKYRYGREYADEFMEATVLNARAMFSSKLLEENQRAVTLKFRTDTLEQLKSGTKWMKQQWIKWFHCLY